MRSLHEGRFGSIASLRQYVGWFRSSANSG
jgi:hypothetical protein